MLSFKKLDVYRCSIQLLALTSMVLETLGKSKGNAVIADQLKRAALSVPLNIAEDAGKSTPGDQTKHYVIARGSAMECGAIYDAALVLKLVDDDTASRAEVVTSEPGLMWGTDGIRFVAALDAIGRMIMCSTVNWILDGDIKAYFDTIDHAWLLKMLGHRIGDERLVPADRPMAESRGTGRRRTEGD